MVAFRVIKDAWVCPGGSGLTSSRVDMGDHWSWNERYLDTGTPARKDPDVDREHHR